MYNDIKRLSTATQQLASAAAVIYTAPAGKRAQICTILLHNTNTTNELVSVFDDGSGVANRLLFALLVPGDTMEFSPKVPIVLEGAETLQAFSTTAAKVNVKIYGREQA